MRVVVAGGGIAALEVLTGLRTLAGKRVAVTLLAPERSFWYRPLSSDVPFSFRRERTRAIAELASALGAEFVRDGLAQVDEARRRVMTYNGDFLSFDALVLAAGARTQHGGGGSAWRRGREATAKFARLLREIEDGSARKVAFVVPSRAAWPVDAYELALVASLAAGTSRSDAEVSVLTAETAPLEAFGAATTDAIRAELARSGVELVTGVEVSVPNAREEAGRDAFSSAVARLSRRERWPHRGDRLVLRLTPGTSLAVDRALFLPAVHGPALPGTAHDRNGFVSVDEHARVSGSDGVYAAGDITALSLKHSTLASGQGAAAAEAIAAVAGAGVDPEPWSPTLYGILALPPHFAAASGSPWLDGGEPLTHCLWWPPGHVAGRHLAPFLAASDPGVTPGLEWHPDGVPIAASIPQSAELPLTAPTTPPETAVRRDAMYRQLMAVRRAERAGERLEQALERRLRDFDAHEREVIAKLRAAGYLRGS